MQVDIEGAVRIAALAKEFDWTGYVDDLPQFCDLAGWEIARSGENGATLRTDMDVRRPEARVFKQKRIFEYISPYVTDIVDRSVQWGEARKLVVDAFADLGNALISTIGIPDRTIPGIHPAMGWDNLNISIDLRGSLRSVSLELSNPKYR
ncbi:DUF6301 family protein [Nocardia sp. NBC_01499]|uniref:DUF6301 family protein n=1 Tax=Nocardia sp. NBC_01499 TaxID=2903597 RepID=UPI003868ECD2